MMIYKATKMKINWGAYYAVGYNYIESKEIKYFTTKEKAMAFVGEVNQFNKIEEIEVE